MLILGSRFGEHSSAQCDWNLELSSGFSALNRSFVTFCSCFVATAVWKATVSRREAVFLIFRLYYVSKEHILCYLSRIGSSPAACQ